MMQTRRLFKLLTRTLASLTVLLAIVGTGVPAAVAATPPGFLDLPVANVASPTALAFTPDGRMLVANQPGVLRVFQQDGLLLATALTFSSAVLCSDFERGLLGISVDPSFAANHYIYLYYTFKKFGSCPENQPTNPANPVNRVSRFTLPDSNVILTTTEVVLLDNLPSPAGNHNGGDLHFGRDGYLYISVGDGGCQIAPPNGCAGSNQNARRLDLLSGKILRVNSDGTIPAGNPYASASGARRCGDPAGVPSGTGPCRETFVWGLRNPFRIAFDPNAPGTRFFINDVGQNAWEEIDEAQLGSDYGWNCREGTHLNSTTGLCNPTPPNMVNPIFEYEHGTTVPGTSSANCNAITGGAFVPNGLWPGYDGAYVFSDYICGSIFKLVQDTGGIYIASDFVTALGNSSAVTLSFGPYGATQALYYTTYAGGGQVRRIVATQAPTAVISASPDYGPVPLAVTFTAGGTHDPSCSPVRRDWNFGDGAVLTNTTGLTTTHTYTATGVLTATLTARDNCGLASAAATTRVYPGDTPPTPTITLPLTSTRFYVGQTITLQGSATDPEEGSLPASALSWNILLHHVDQVNPGGAHTHPLFSTQGVTTTAFTAPAPEDLQATALSDVEIQLSAADSWGLVATITQTLQPNRLNVTFATQPSGLQVVANGVTLTATGVISSWQGYALNLSVPEPQFGAGQWWLFDAWSDGGAAAHTLITPSTAVTYTAAFQPGFLLWLPDAFK